MSDRVEPYYYQEVTEGEVETWHDHFENADQAIVEEHDSWGIMSGMVVAEQGVPDMTVQISDGVAYDENGQRIPLTGGPTTVDLSTYEPAVGGQERWVGVYIETDRLESDARVDGDANPLNYLLEESFAFHIESGAAGAPPQAKPAIVANKVLLAHVELTNGMGAITNAEIDMDWFNIAAASVDRQVGGLAAPGRLLDTTRRIAYDPAIGDSVIAIGASNSINFDSGNGLNATKLEAEQPDVAADQGHLYVNPATGAKRDVVKDWSYDASAMFPGTKGAGSQSPWTLPIVINNWYLAENAVAPMTVAGDLGWRMDVNTGGIGSLCGLYVPLDIPDKAKLISALVGYTVDGVGMNGIHFLRLWLMRRSAVSTDILGANPPANERNAAPGNYTWAENYTAGATQIVDNSLYSYYLIILHWINGALAGEDSVEIKWAYVRTHIRESSHEY